MNRQNINRRNILKLTALSVFGTTLSNQNVQAAEKSKISSAGKAQIGNLKQNFIKTGDGEDLYFKDWGKGEAIVFIHSWAANSDLWQYQMNGLAEAGFRCIAYDRRGHGRSSQPWHGYDYDTLAADLNAVIENLKLDKVILVSHSMADGEIVRYLTRYGTKRVSKIIITSPNLPFILKTADNPDGFDKILFEQFRNALKKDVAGTLQAGAPGFFGENPKLSKDLMDWAINMCHQTALRAMLECNRANTETDFRAEMSKISIPTLIIHGEKDVSAPLKLTAEKCVSLIPNAKLIVYKDAPHGIILTHHEEMTRDILEFIKSQK